jgi:hypothetical protein
MTFDHGKIATLAHIGSKPIGKTISIPERFLL